MGKGIHSFTIGMGNAAISRSSYVMSTLFKLRLSTDFSLTIVAGVGCYGDVLFSVLTISFVVKDGVFLKVTGILFGILGRIRPL